jgi:hypothetical protein
MSGYPRGFRSVSCSDRVVARKYDGSKARKAGRPRTSVDIEQLIVRVVSSNPRWGYTRIRGALRNLGHEVVRNTIKRIFAANGIERWMRQVARNLSDVYGGFLAG